MKKSFRIMVPIDFSDLSKEALFAAASVARRMKGSLILVHVVDYLPESPFFLQGTLPDTRDNLLEMRLHKESLIEKLLDDEHLRGLPVKTIFALGVADKEIIERAKRHKVDLILMSTHGRSGVSHFLLGSVAEKVIRKAPCPVLIMNPTVLASFNAKDRVNKELEESLT